MNFLFLFMFLWVGANCSGLYFRDSLNPNLGLETYTTINYSEKYIPGPCQIGEVVQCLNSQSISAEIIKSLWNGSGLDLNTLGHLTGILRSFSGPRNGNLTLILGNRPGCSREVRVVLEEPGNFQNLLENLEAALTSVDRILGSEEVYLYSDGTVRSEPIPVRQILPGNVNCECQVGSDLQERYGARKCLKTDPEPLKEILPEVQEPESNGPTIFDSYFSFLENFLALEKS